MSKKYFFVINSNYFLIFLVVVAFLLSFSRGAIVACIGIVLFAYSFNEAFRLSQHSVHQTEQLIAYQGFLIIWMVPSSHALYVSKSACL